MNAIAVVWEVCDATIWRDVTIKTAIGAAVWFIRRTTRNSAVRGFLDTHEVLIRASYVLLAAAVGAFAALVAVDADADIGSCGTPFVSAGILHLCFDIFYIYYINIY